MFGKNSVTVKDFWKNFDQSFKSTDQYWVGFDKMMQTHRDAHKAFNAAFPPHNVKKINDNKYQIEIAVAGYDKEDLTVEIEDDILRVYSKQSEEKNEDDEYIFHGIAKRWFEKAWRINSFEVKNVEMVNGMLKIWLDAAEQVSKATQLEIK